MQENYKYLTASDVVNKLGRKIIKGATPQTTYWVCNPELTFVGGAVSGVVVAPMEVNLGEANQVDYASILVALGKIKPGTDRIRSNKFKIIVGTKFFEDRESCTSYFVDYLKLVVSRNQKEVSDLENKVTEAVDCASKAKSNTAAIKAYCVRARLLIKISELMVNTNTTSFIISQYQDANGQI